MFAGVGPASSPTALGVKLTGVTFGIALMREVGVTSPRSYVALKAAGSAELVGISGFTLAGSLEFDSNSAKNGDGTDGTALDLTRLAGGGITVATGPTTSVLLDFSGRLLRVSGTVTLGIDDYVRSSRARR